MSSDGKAADTSMVTDTSEATDTISGYQK